MGNRIYSVERKITRTIRRFSGISPNMN